VSEVPLLLKSLVEPAEASPIRWTLDCPTRGVVILDVAVGQSASDAPLHWRAGDWTKPPLDVRLSDVGAVESIQFVFQDESVEAGNVVPPPEAEIGLPTFDVREWPEDRYSDARVAVKTLRLPSGELYAAIGDRQAERAVSVTWGLRFDFDSADQLVGIALGPLTGDEWQLVDASAPLTGG
jgi:hypothetical protein